jgi:phosphatidate cytidylyltransferase
MNNELAKRLLTSLIISILTFFFILKGGILFIVFLLCIFFISLYEWFNLHTSKAVLIFGICILVISFLSTYLLRAQNLGYFLLIILISISSDIGGFIFGKLFKGPKLTKISPNKTYIGSFGSYLLSIISCFVYVRYFGDNLNLFLKELSFSFFVLIFLFSTINQLGDLCISYFKRKKKVNDTGTLLPGHGGLLDRIDGMIFVYPLSYIYYLFL